MKLYYIYTSLCFTLALLVPSDYVKAQDKANYILTETHISSNSQKKQNYVFYDGLGRETFKATNGISSNGDFTYFFSEIIGEQMVTKNWLPIVDNPTIANLSKNDIKQKSSIQYTDNYAFANYEYDALGRLKKQHKAGYAWKAKPATISYVTNSSNDVKKYTVSSIGTAPPHRRWLL